jgi:hypothetical protein
VAKTYPKIPANESKEACAQLAQKVGALADTGMGCIVVYGKRIDIQRSIHSIEEGFRITNFNFRANRPVEKQSQLPGNSESLQKQNTPAAPSNLGSGHVA